MKTIVPVLVSALLISMAGGQVPIAPGAELELVSDGYSFTEGPAADADGNVYFTDQPNDRILKWSVADGKVTTFMQPARRSNGLYFDQNEQLIACADQDGELVRIDPTTKKVTVLLDHFDKKLFNGPNDVWVRPDGGMYFTDPFYKRPYWKGREKPEQKQPRVYFLARGAKAPVIVEDTLKQPNGIIGTPDGKGLFVADIGAGKTYCYEVAEDGKLVNRKLFCELGSDGMTLDEAGNLYLTGKGVIVFDQSGKKLGVVEIDKGWTANVCFGGPEMKTLFITAMDSAFRLKMAVKGIR